MAGASSGRDAAVDIARGLAIFYVVAVWHGNDYFGKLWSNPATRLLTSCALGYFFCVSAALVSRRLAPFRNRDDVKSFLKRRFRLYPEYLLALVLLWALNQIDKKSALAGLFALNPLIDRPLRTLWFVAALFFFQATVPALMWKTGDPKRILPRAFLVFAALFAAHRFLGLVDVRLLYYWPVFAAGLLLDRDGGELRLPPAWTALPALFCAVVEIGGIAPFAELVLPVRDAFYAFAGASLLPWLVRAIRPAAARSALAKFGLVSSGVYLYHRITIDLGLRILPQDALPLPVAILWVALLGVGVSALFGIGVERLRVRLDRPIAKEAK